MKIAIPLAGEMGAGIAGVLTRHGNTVLTCLDGRSDATRARAEAAGMQAASWASLCTADVFLSVVPPGIAEEIAGRFAANADAASSTLYADLNAVNPDTVRRIEAGMPEHVRFADGSIIGGPPRADGYRPRLYFSGPAARDALSLQEQGLQSVALDGGTGTASALKMCYGAITKGSAGLMAAIFMAAEREGAGAALHAEMRDSQASRLQDARAMLPTVYPKAYRWVAEMEQIGAFLGEDRAESGIWQALAGFYQRMADDVDGAGRETGAVDRFLSRDDLL